jgi:formate hydrogenlyase subunit 3/multisubunit Na+/H+ antiporter MnhD subunit
MLTIGKRKSVFEAIIRMIILTLFIVSFRTNNMIFYVFCELCHKMAQFILIVYMHKSLGKEGLKMKNYDEFAECQYEDAC